MDLAIDSRGTDSELEGAVTPGQASTVERTDSNASTKLRRTYKGKSYEACLGHKPTRKL